MSIAVYPGSFNPFHKGHQDILYKAAYALTNVDIAIGINPDKSKSDIAKRCESIRSILSKNFHFRNVRLKIFEGTLVDFLKTYPANGESVCAVVRGLRDGNDFESELKQQYWNEDVGVVAPFAYFGANRGLRHVSRSSIRMVEKLGLKHPHGVPLGEESK